MAPGARCQRQQRRVSCCSAASCVGLDLCTPAHVCVHRTQAMFTQSLLAQVPSGVPQRTGILQPLPPGATYI